MSRDDAALLDILQAARLALEFRQTDEVDLHGVWRTLESDLPELIQAIQPLTPGRPPTEGG